MRYLICTTQWQETFFTWHMICSLEEICKSASSGKVHWLLFRWFSRNMKLATAYHPATNQLLLKMEDFITFKVHLIQ